MLINTVDSLHALPAGSVILDSNDVVRVKRAYSSTGRAQCQVPLWVAPDDAVGPVAMTAFSLIDTGQLTLLHVPGRNFFAEAKADALDEAAERTAIPHAKAWLAKRAAFYRTSKLIVPTVEKSPAAS